MLTVSHAQDAFVKRARKLGYEIDGASAKTLQQGFDAIKEPEVALCLDLLKRKAMQRFVLGI
jgi:protein SSD1